jgi:hypothetical protein
MREAKTALLKDRRCLLSLCSFGTTADAITSYLVMGSPKMREAKTALLSR